MQEKKAALDDAREELGEAGRAASGNGHLVGVQAADKRAAAEALAERLNELLEEIHDLGCELKGIDEGLIDFPAERDGQTIYLCWKLGEERIGHWHELDTGFASRRPL